MSRLYTDPSDDYALPKALCASLDVSPRLNVNLHDEYDEPRTWVHTQSKEQVQHEAHERELRFDEPRWGEMGGGEGDE